MRGARDAAAKLAHCKDAPARRVDGNGARLLRAGARHGPLARRCRGWAALTHGTAKSESAFGLRRGAHR